MFTKASAITFDVGHSCVHVCQLGARRGSVQLLDKLRFERTSSVAEPAERAPAENAKNAVAGARSPIDCKRLARLVAQARFSGADVGLVLSPPDVRFLSTRLNDVILRQSPERIRAAIAFEAARDARVDAAELEVRYWPLPAGHSHGHNVMSMALQKRWAMQWFEQLRAHKLFLRRIDAAPCAMARFANELWTPQERDLWAVLDIGAQQSVLTVMIGHIPVYIRSLTASAAAWTRRLSKSFDLELAEAEALKRLHGVRTETENGPPSSVDMSRAIFDILRTELDGLVRELDMCCSYVVQSYTDVEMRRLFLCGGGSALRGLDEFLSLHLGISVGPLVHSGPSESTARPRGTLRLEQPAGLSPVQHAEFAGSVGAALLDLEAA